MYGHISYMCILYMYVCMCEHACVSVCICMCVCVHACLCVYMIYAVPGSLRSLCPCPPCASPRRTDPSSPNTTATTRPCSLAAALRWTPALPRRPVLPLLLLLPSLSLPCGRPFARTRPPQVGQSTDHEDPAELRSPAPALPSGSFLRPLPVRRPSSSHSPVPKRRSDHLTTRTRGRLQAPTMPMPQPVLAGGWIAGP